MNVKPGKGMDPTGAIDRALNNAREATRAAPPANRTAAMGDRLQALLDEFEERHQRRLAEMRDELAAVEREYTRMRAVHKAYVAGERAQRDLLWDFAQNTAKYRAAVIPQLRRAAEEKRKSVLARRAAADSASA